MADWVAWQRTGQEEGSIQGYLITALERSGLCITVQNRDLDYLYIANLFDGYVIPENEDPDDINLFGIEIADRLKILKDEAIVEAGQRQAEIVTDDERCFEFVVEAIQPGGTPLILTRINDLSQKRLAEQVTKTLLREVSHRSKNLLAIVQSLASQTARTSSTVEGFAEEFRGRLHALSQAQDLITESSWRGAMLKDLLFDQVERYLPQDREVHFEGVDVRLTPSTSIHLGLALHELVRKATKIIQRGECGVFINVSCTHTSLLGERAVELKWEMADPTPSSFSEEDQDFGRILLEKVVPASIQGRAEYVQEDGNLAYTIDIPLSDTAQERL